MGICRAVVRFIAAVVWCVSLSLWVWITNRAKGEIGARRAAMYTRLWARGGVKIINMKLTIHGDPEKFSGGLVVGNHQSYLDILIHGSVFPLRFAPKIEMKSWPFIGFMTGLSRPVWIDRSSRQKSKISAEAMADTMRGGIPMIVYAEGTTTDGQHGLLPFKSTPFEAVAEAGLPILPILTFYDPVKGGKFSMAWSGSDKLLPHVWRVLGLKESRAEVFVLEQVAPLPGEDRKELARRVHDLMEREYWRIKNHG